MEERNSYFASAPLKLVVEGKPFYAHPGLISRLSEPLARLIGTPFSSEKKGDSDGLRNVNAATFDRFLEWAYKGDYTQPSPTIDSKIGKETEGNTKHAPKPTKSEDRETDMPVVGTVKKSKKRMAGTPLYAHEEDAFRQPEPAFSPREKLKKAFCDFHAELYVFAVQNELEELKTLALNKLHAVLATFELYQERTGDVIALLGYTYANTKSSESGKEPLRELLANYVAFQMDTLMLDDGFEGLMKEGGDMLSDYMSSVLKRIKS